MEVKDIWSSMDFGPAFEADEEAQAWLEKHGRSFGHFINGHWHKPKKNDYFNSINPCNFDELAKLSQASQKEVDLAVDAAKTALEDWAGLSCFERSKYIYAIARQIQKHARLFAVLESLDNGKPIRETRDIDIPLVARHFYYHAGWALERDNNLPKYKEIGVVGQIIPWNFPLLMLAWKIAPAISMGNTVVLKPAEQTSLTALLFAEICDQVGLPPGVVNIITGDGETGKCLVSHKGINKIAFTGSTEVGKLIRKSIAGSGKKLTLELGGKSPFIVFEDADLDSAIEGIVDAIWFNQGQVCCAGSRLLVQESIADTFHEKLKRRMKKLRVGSSLDKNIDIGAIVSKTQFETIDEYVRGGIQAGLTCWQHEIPSHEKGYYYPPTLFTNISPAAEIAQQEIFGPVLVSMSFRHHHEAVALANNTVYGLAASVWTEDINLALAIAPQIKAGTIWINSTNLFDAAAGFGGYKESGFGREGGKEGLYAYVKLKEEDSSQNQKKSNEKENSYVEDPAIFSKIDQTAKLYIGGKQKRPDGGYTSIVKDINGKVIGEVGKANRKDIRNAVEAAHASKSWASKSGHERAQVLYFIAENLSVRTNEFSQKIKQSVGCSLAEANLEVQCSIKMLFRCAAWADKNDGTVHSTLKRFVTLAMPESLGVIGVLCPEENPLLSFIALTMPAIAMGNSIIAIPSETAPLVVTDFYQVLNTSDLPGGVLNILTGSKAELGDVLSKHYDVEAVFCFDSVELCTQVEGLAADNMKRTWLSYGKSYNWLSLPSSWMETALQHATQVKNIWIPYGI